MEDDFSGSHTAPVRSTGGEDFDSRDLRNALGTFGTGVTIITARGRDGGLYGLTAGSMYSVPGLSSLPRLGPPLIRSVARVR